MSREGDEVREKVIRILSEAHFQEREQRPEARKRWVCGDIRAEWAAAAGESKEGGRNLLWGPWGGAGS